MPDKPFKLFIKDRSRRLLVVMGVPGSVDSTEVGVFFEPAGDGQVVLEIASLSSHAAAAAAEIIFTDLERKFPVINAERPDHQELP